MMAKWSFKSRTETPLTYTSASPSRVWNDGGTSALLPAPFGVPYSAPGSP